jgi:NAD(P)-dependent dehydrogenase (short-subunit alcohol dehydrogenase family)
MNVLVTYRTSPAAAETTVVELQAIGVEVCAFRVDLADAAAVAQLADGLLAQAGLLLVVVNNASVYPRTRLSEISAETWDAILAANLRTVSSVTAPGPAYEADGAACLSFLPALPRLQGRIDLHDQRGRARVGAQGAGQLRLPGSGAVARGLRCRHRGGGPALHTARGLGDPDEIARAVRFFVESVFATGAILTVDGGRLIA